MRIGIIGAGTIAAAHAGAIRANADAELAGFHDIDGSRARATADAFGCRTFRSAESMYEAVDGVVIASPNHTHARIAAAAVQSGRHVLCEKPMAVSTAEARTMAELAQNTGLSCCVGFNYRFLSVVQRARQAITSGELGTPLLVEVGFRRGSALSRSVFTWRDSSIGRSTSGALGDLGVHLIDLLHFLFRSDVDPAVCLTGLRTHVPERDGRAVSVDDHAFATGRLGNGVYFNLTASKSSLSEELGLSLKVIGTRGELRYHSRDAHTLLTRTDVDWHAETLPGSRIFADPAGEVAGWADTFHLQLKEWTDVVIHGKESGWLAGFDDGLRAQQVLEQLLDQGLPFGSSWAQPDPNGSP